MPQPIDRRHFLRTSLGVTAGTVLLPAQDVKSAKQDPTTKKAKPSFDISLAQWSLNKRLRGRAEPKLDNLDFAKTARALDIAAIEYVNTFFKSKVHDPKYIADMKKRASDHGVKSLLIMCDGLGALGAPKEARRARAIDNHEPWLAAAKELGCHSIRVNARSRGSYEEQMKLAVDGLTRLSEKGKEYGLNVLVENHGGLSSNGAWLAAVMKKVGMPNCGTLPDFGNFGLGRGKVYDRYKGVAELMPYAKAVSAKAHEFDAEGNETHTDFLRMMKIVLRAGYRGWVGIEYEGEKLDELSGIRATKRLLERVRSKLAG